MYIQEDRGLPFTLPKGYSGSAFQEPTPPQAEASPPAPQGDEDASAPLEGKAVQASEAEPAQASEAEAPASTLAGLFGRVPFLSSLLPPPRRKKEGGLPEWAIVALILFLLNDNREGDLLPLLLLLLLWD